MHGNLELLAGVMCGVIMLAAFGTHIVSGPTFKYWMTFPQYVRFGLGAVGVTFMVWSVNLFSIAQQPLLVGPGRINAEGFVALATVTYLAVSLFCWAFATYRSRKQADRMEWAKTLKDEEIIQVAKAQGMYVNGELPVEHRG